MKWFGPAPFSHVCDDAPEVPTPDGTCAWCDEPFTIADSGYLIPFLGEPDAPSHHGYHVECWLRQVIGSVGHIRGRCSCYGGTEEDPPHLTRREAADAAVTAFRTLGPHLPH